MKSVNVNLSDHNLVLLIYKKPREEKRPIVIQCRKFSEDNVKWYKDALREQDWSFVFNLDDPNDIWDKMYEIMNRLVDKFCPIRTLRVSKNRPPYIDDRIIELGHLRDKLFKIAKKSGMRDDWILAKRQRLLVNYAVRKSKSVYYKNKLTECKGDTRKFWAHVKE